MVIFIRAFILSRQGQIMIGNLRKSTGKESAGVEMLTNSNKIRFNVASTKDQTSREYPRLIQFYDSIKPWEQGANLPNQQVRDIFRLNTKQQPRYSKQQTKGASQTSRSWNLSKQKKPSTPRQQFFMAAPIIRPETTIERKQSEKMVSYLKRGREKQHQSAEEIPEKFHRHHKLLSRIFNHSCDTKPSQNAGRLEVLTRAHPRFKIAFKLRARRSKSNFESRGKDFKQKSEMEGLYNFYFKKLEDLPKKYYPCQAKSMKNEKTGLNKLLIT